MINGSMINPEGDKLNLSMAYKRLREIETTPHNREASVSVMISQKILNFSQKVSLTNYTAFTHLRSNHYFFFISCVKYINTSLANVSSMP